MAVIDPLKKPEKRAPAQMVVLEFESRGSEKVVSAIEQVTQALVRLEQQARAAAKAMREMQLLIAPPRGELESLDEQAGALQAKS